MNDQELANYSVKLGDVSAIFGELAKIAIETDRDIEQVVRVALRNYIASTKRNDVNCFTKEA